MSEKVIVSVSEGKIHGLKNVSTFSGVEFYSFLGVSYGQSTAGRARYKDPIPVKPWKNVLMAMTEKGGCLQFSLKKGHIDGSENCLYNNIHTPEISGVKKVEDVYKFEFQGNAPKMKDLYQFAFEEPLGGTYHGVDFSYWARFSLSNNKTAESLTPETEDMVKTFTKLITTFARTGNPNYEWITTQWKPSTVENPCYLSVNNQLSMVEGKLNGNRAEFWDDLRRELENNYQAI